MVRKKRYCLFSHSWICSWNQPVPSNGGSFLIKETMRALTRLEIL